MGPAMKHPRSTVGGTSPDGDVPIGSGGQTKDEVMDHPGPAEPPSPQPTVAQRLDALELRVGRLMALAEEIRARLPEGA